MTGLLICLAVILIGVLLLLAGKDYGTREQRARSWEMFMQEVAPRLRSLNPDQPGVPA